MKEWSRGMELFYETKGTMRVVKDIRDNSVVVITGNSGSGKTTAMHHASVQLQRNGYEIVLISSPNDIPTQRFVSQKQVFVMDDVVGSCRVDKMAISLWRRLHDRIRVVFNDKNAKLLMTIQPHLLENIRIIIPSEVGLKIVDLNSDELALSEDEKKGMLDTYLKNRLCTNPIVEDDMVNICSNNIAFPLLCNMFTSNEKFLNEKAKFFRSPSVFFEKDLNSLQDENPKMYCVLVLLLIFDIKDLHCIFKDIGSKIERSDDYISILHACGVSENIPRKSLQDHLRSMAGSYVQPKHHFKFIHESFEETLACHFGSRFPDVFLKCCKLDFIRNKIRVNTGLRHNKCTPKDRNILIVKSKPLVQRILEEVKKGKFYDVLLSEPMQDDVHFIEEFVHHAAKDLGSLEQLENLTSTEKIPLMQYNVCSHLVNVTLAKKYGLFGVFQRKKTFFIHWVTAFGSFPLFKALFERPKSIPRQAFDKFIAVTELLHLAVLGKHIDTIRLLIDRGGNVKSYDEHGIPLLCKVASTHRCNIAELLINHGADVDQCDQMMGWTPCFVASWFGEVEMLNCLIKNNANINKQDFRNMTPLVLGLLKNNGQIVSLLLTRGAKFNAAFFSNYEATKKLNFELAMENTKKINVYLTDTRKTLLTSFNPFNKTKSLKREIELYLKGMTANGSENASWIQICNEVYPNHPEKLGDMLSKDYNRTMMGNFNKNCLLFTPLHIATICNDVVEVKKLIKQGYNPLQKDIWGKTSLHLANSSEMVKVLLNADCLSKRASRLSIPKFIHQCFRFCFLFEFISLLFRRIACSDVDAGINTRDNQGNTPLNSIINRSSDINRCFGVVETLVNNGAATDIRCNKGYLPIDNFRTHALKLEEDIINRGETLLDGDKTKRYLKKEKLFFGTLALFYLIFYIWFYIELATELYIQEEKTQVENLIFSKRISWIFSYAQISSIIILHWYIRKSNSSKKIETLNRFEVTPAWIKLYSEQLFERFSEKIAVVFVIFRVFFSMLGRSVSVDVFYNVYCVALSLFFLIIYIPNPFRTVYLNCTFIRIIKIVFVFYSILWILYSSIMFFKNSEAANVDHRFNSYHKWSDFFNLIAKKLIFFYLYVFMFMHRVLDPLIVNKLEPLLWRLRERKQITVLCKRLFLIVDILSVPFTMMCYTAEDILFDTV